MTDPLSITPDDLADGRFDRFKLIGWWDQEKLASARVLVIGAGALGNEIIKNLALLGIGNVLVADKDKIENSNLSRSVLYRAADAGQPKAAIAARAARDIYPDIKVNFFDGDIIHDLGAGVYRWADVIIGGLDNREARLSMNRQSWRVGKPWIDGAIEVIQGVARVFTPDAAQENPCYECTMSENDWKLLQHRRSCNLLTRTEMETGKTPTTPTIASIIAGVQVQEAVKLLHNMPTIAGQGFVFAGATADSYLVGYQRKPDCASHDTLSEIIEIEGTSDEITFADLLARARDVLGENVTIDLGRDVARQLVCTTCKRVDLVYRSLGKLTTRDGICPTCQTPTRQVETFASVRGQEDFLNRPIAELGIPRFDILTARTSDRSIGLEITGDAAQVLGELAESGLEWK